MLRTNFCPVPAFIRVEPEITSGPVGVCLFQPFSDASFDHLQAQGLRTLGNAKRNQIYIQMQQQWDKNANTVWIAWPTYYFGTKKGIQPAISPHAWTIASSFKKA